MPVTDLPLSTLINEISLGKIAFFSIATLLLSISSAVMVRLPSFSIATNVGFRLKVTSGFAFMKPSKWHQSGENSLPQLSWLMVEKYKLSELIKTFNQSSSFGGQEWAIDYGFHLTDVVKIWSSRNSTSHDRCAAFISYENWYESKISSPVINGSS